MKLSLEEVAESIFIRKCLLYLFLLLITLYILSYNKIKTIYLKYLNFP